MRLVVPIMNSSSDIENAPPKQSKLKRPTRDFKSFFEHVKALGFSPSVCIDIGAAKGTNSIYSAFPEALHIVFEPLPDFHDDLELTMKGFRHEIHHCALMDKAESRKLLRHPDRFGSSLMHTRKQTGRDLVDVETKTLDSVVGSKNLSEGLLIKTDCQGADLFVIKGASETLKQADIVIMESSLFSFWGEHHPDIYDIIVYMKAKGFAVYDILDGLFRPSDGALGQVDLVFVKGNGVFRESRRW